MTNLNIKPDIKISVKQTFGIESDMEVDAFSKKSEFVPEIDKDYIFDKDTTIAILSGFNFNKRVMVQGFHGTGKIYTYYSNCCTIKLALRKSKS